MRDRFLTPKAQLISLLGRKHTVIALLFFGVLLTTGLPGGALDDAYMQQTLRGLPGVMVTVEPLLSEVERDGLLTAELRTEIEQQLRRAGIRILTAEERERTPGKPLFYVNITMWKGRHRGAMLYLFSIRIELQQEVFLARDPALRRLVPTWHVGSVGMASADRLRSIHSFVSDFVTQFIHAYRAVNPQS